MPVSNQTDVTLGIIGLGNMGSAHARMFLEGKIPGARLAGVCDSSPERLQTFPDTPGWADPEAMLAEAAVDAVIVSTPHYSHVPLGIRALESGRHVLVEKPIAVHKADAERLVAAHTNPEQVFAVMFNQRTDPRYQWVRSRMADGTLGRINRVNWTITDWFRTEHYYQHGSWRATWAGEGGGVLINQCPHQLDLWQWMFGMPQRVHAFCQLGRFHEIEVEDDVTAYLAYDDGMSGIFTTTTGEAPGTNRLEIAAENGRVVIEGNEIRFDHNLTPASEFCATSDQSFAAPETQRETVTVNNTGQQHLGILKNFVGAIRGTEPLLAPASEGIRSVELGNAMLHSGLTGESVYLPLDGAAYARALQQRIDASTFRKKTVDSPGGAVEDLNNSF